MIAVPLPADDPGLSAALQAAHLPADDLTEPGRVFFRFEDDGKTVGFGGLEMCGDNGLLRSLVMLPDFRGKGYGRRAVALLLKEASKRGAKGAFLLATDAAEFFRSSGFQPIVRDSAPPEILATRQASALCPSSAVLMTCRL